MRIITLTEEMYVLQRYKEDQIGYAKIAKELSTDKKKVKKVLEKHGVLIEKRKQFRNFKIKEDFFEKIDTEEKAYVLGFLWADGNISKDLKYIRFLNQAKDVQILKDISSLIFEEKKEVIVDVKYNRAYMNICSKKMVKDLLKLGCSPKKSLIIKFPSSEHVPDFLISHFIRGYFDGDGCVYLKKSSINVSFAISKPFFEGFSKFLSKLGCSFYTEDIGSIFVVKIIGNFSGLKLLNFIYKDYKIIFLKRKVDKLIESLRQICLTNKRIYNRTKPILRESLTLFELSEKPVFFHL